MTAYHVVHVAPASPDRLKETAYARLSATARKIRHAHLVEGLFLRHSLGVNDVFTIEGNTFIPNLQDNVSEVVIADLTQTVRLCCSLWQSARPGRLDHEPVELARKMSEYLDVDAQMGNHLQRWANTYARRHAGPPAFEKLDSASKELLRMASGNLPLGGPQTDHAVDELVAAVHARAPWHSHVTTSIWHHLRSSRDAGRSGLSVPPLLLHGPPGTGKSTFARILAQQANMPYIELDVGAGTTAFRIAGVEAGWGTRQIGDVVRLVCESRAANPIVIINEVDKIGRGATSGSGTRTSMGDALLPLLEGGTAAQFRCPASGLDHDLSRINWVLTANEIDWIDPVLRSRMKPIEVSALSRSDLDLYIDIAIPTEDRDVVRHIHRLAKRLRGFEQEHFLN